MAISSRVAEEGTRKQSGTLRKPPPNGVGRLPTVLLQLEERGRGACTGEAVGRVSEEQRRCFLVVKVHLFELVPLAGGILSLVQIVQVLVSQPLRQLNVAQLPVFELEGQPHWHLAATEPSAGSQSTRPETRKQAGPLQQAAALHVAASARAHTHTDTRARNQSSRSESGTWTGILAWKGPKLPERKWTSWNVKCGVTSTSSSSATATIQRARRAGTL